MNTSKSLIAAAVIALLPLAAIAGDKDKSPASMGTTAPSEQFNTLDANRDGRISRAEAASDSKIVFSSADKNADGFLDSSEFMHRDMSSDPTTSTGNPATSAEKPRE